MIAVVGDRRIVRFLREKQNNAEQAAQLYFDFLKWRQANSMDAVRNDILHNGKSSPFDFPNGQKILALAPQIIICTKAPDLMGRPLVVESYGFSPKEVRKIVTDEEYLTFFKYSLEYRALVLEQLSHEREAATSLRCNQGNRHRLGMVMSPWSSPYETCMGLV